MSNSQQPHGLRCARPPCPSPAPGVYRSTDSVGRAGGGSCAQTRVREPLLSPSSQTLSPGKPLLGGPAGDHHWAPCIGFVWGCTLRHRPQRQLPGPTPPPTPPPLGLWLFPKVLGREGQSAAGGESVCWTKTQQPRALSLEEAKEVCEEEPIDFNYPQTAHRDK